MGNYTTDPPTDDHVVYGFRISSVGPARVTGSNSTYDPTNLDLAMKLHYHRVVYLFEGEAVKGCDLTTARFKEAAFTWLAYYYETCGRFRLNEPTGRPYIKCNDCGARFVEAKSSKTAKEWVELNYEDASWLRLLVPSQVLGPELTFSPPVFIQVTSLKCGGVAIGMGIAHVLGDFFSVSEYLNFWAKTLSGYRPTHSPNLNKLTAHEPKGPISPGPEPLTLQRVGPVGDHWAVSSPSKMATFSFQLTSTQLANLQTKVSGLNGPTGPIPYFESVCGVIWQAVAKAKSGADLKRVTVIKIDDSNAKKEIIRNTQILSVVEAEFEVMDADPETLAQLISERAVDERATISKTVEKELGASDFLVYGSNLTFVNLEEADCYGFLIKGHRPCLVNCFVDAIGEEGAVFVLPEPATACEKKGGEGRLVTLVLPVGVMLDVKKQLAKDWSIACA